MESGASLQIRDLWVDLDEFLLRELTLDVASGEYLVVLGPTGAGKTVLLETIAGLFAPRRGRVLIDGEDVTQVPPEHRGIGFVYQDYMLFPHLTVEKNLAFGPSLTRPTRLFGRRAGNWTGAPQVEAVSRMVSIDHLLHRRPATLSGGERQRVALARALVVGPRILLLDEPLSALDPETRVGLERDMARIHRELGATSLHVTHDFEEAVALGDRIAVMHHGRLVQVGTPEEVFRRPESEFVARFVGAHNIFEGTITGHAGKAFKTFAVSSSSGSGHGELEVAVLTDLSGEAHVAIRPEDIVLSLDPPHPASPNCFRARIVDIADRGTLIHVTLRTPLEIACVVTRRCAEEMELQSGKEVHIAFKPEVVHVF